MEKLKEELVNKISKKLMRIRNIKAIGKLGKSSGDLPVSIK